MTQCNSLNLKEVASAITSDSLDAAKKAITIECQEYLSWVGFMSLKIEEIACISDQKKLAKALALVMLGHLPTKPITCPFCIQYTGDKICKGCGYAQTHGGRCDEDTSAFNRFIEAFQELGKAILQDQDDSELLPDIEQGKQKLREFASVSAEKARQMMEDLPEASADQFMEIKALYLDQMVGLIPVHFFLNAVVIEQKKIRKALKDYW
jgi:hypothetical protein